MKLTCAEYNYSYSYMPDAVIFGKSISFQGSEVMSLKVLIDDELYEMEAVFLK